MKSKETINLVSTKLKKKKTQTKRISSFSFFMALISIYNIFFFTPYALSFIPSPWQW
jgi:hypothetical protein